MSLMAVDTNPMIISGIQNDRNCPNVALNVMKMRPNHSGNTNPAPIPAKIAMMMRGKSPMRLKNALCFINSVYFDILS